MELHLVDLEPDVVECWLREFEEFPGVHILCGDILSAADCAVVSPANSFGVMDGGIDLAYLGYFGTAVQERVQAAIARRPEGYLPVGAAVVVGTGDARIPNMVVAPTMYVPGPIDASPKHVFHALSAALRAADRTRLSRLYCPGLGSGVGHLPPSVVAREMAAAYALWRRRGGGPGAA